MNVPQRTAPREILPARRREDLLHIVQEAGQATVAELAGRFDVSSDTIRRDIDYLADLGLLARTHGGAIPTSALASADTPLGNRMLVRADVKAAIGRAASKLIHDGETMIINGGTTTMAVASALGGRHNLTVVTNSLLLPSALPSTCLGELYLIGGGVRLSSMTTSGPVQFAASSGQGSHAFSADVAVIGVGGVSVDSGLSTSSLPDAQMMREMISTAGRLIAVADATKIDHNAFAHICPLDRVDSLISDINLNHPVALAVIEAGGQVITVS